MKVVFLFHLTYRIPSIFQGSFHPELYSRITFIYQFDLLQKVFVGTQCRLFSPVTPQHKPASGRWIKSLEVFETGTVLDDLGVLPRVSFTQIQASKHSFFHCGPKAVSSPNPRGPGWEQPPAVSVSSPWFASRKISWVSVSSLNAFSLWWGRVCSYELFHPQITDRSNLWQGGIATQWGLWGAERSGEGCFWVSEWVRMDIGAVHLCGLLGRTEWLLFLLP